jgi:nucleoside-diphosphate kinase
METTFTIIKPCAVRKGYTGSILSDIIAAGFEISAMKMTHLTPSQVEEFYPHIAKKDFFGEILEYMTSGAIIVAILKRQDAVAQYRKLLGATNPAKAEIGTLRQKYATDISENAVHGADSDQTAFLESNFFFSQCERY